MKTQFWRLKISKSAAARRESSLLLGMLASTADRRHCYSALPRPIYQLWARTACLVSSSSWRMIPMITACFCVLVAHIRKLSFSSAMMEAMNGCGRPSLDCAYLASTRCTFFWSWRRLGVRVRAGSAPARCIIRIHQFLWSAIRGCIERRSRAASPP